MSTPDFDQLGRETPWPCEAWREAWDLLKDKLLWPSVLALAEGAFSYPVTSVQRFNSLVDVVEELRP